MKVFGFAGWSGSGKTTLIEQLIPLLRGRGLRVSLIKHTHHGFDLDRPGKDSHRFRTAGAAEVILAGVQRWALMSEVDESVPPTLEELLARLGPCDLVLVEGFKTADLPKIEVYRPAVGKPFFHEDCPGVLAIASDVPLVAGLPVLDLNNPPEIADFVLNYTGLASSV